MGIIAALALIAVVTGVVLDNAHMIFLAGLVFFIAFDNDY